MMRPQSCHLRRVRDHEDLPPFGEGFQAAPHGIRCGTTDTAINLVENHGQPALAMGQTHFECQEKPAQFTTRGDFIDRARRCAGVGGDGEGHRIGAIRAGRLRRNPRLENRALHFKRSKLCANGFVQILGNFAARV